MGTGKLFLISFLISVFVTSSMAQTCQTQTFTNNKEFTSCRDLPHLTSYLHWTYEQSTGKLDIAFRHSAIASTDRWVAWAINPDNNVDKPMVGSQALVAIPQSSGSPRAYTSSISSYGTQLEEGNISYPHTGLTATYQNSEVTIYATLTLPSGTTSLVHLWQDGPLSGSTPQAHDTGSTNIQAKERLDLLSGSSEQGSSGGSLRRRRNVSTSLF